MFHPSSSSAPTYSDLSMHHAASFSSALPTAPTEIPRGGDFFHERSGSFPLPNVAASAPSPYFYIHRSASSHSLPLHLRLPDGNGNAAFSYSSLPVCQFPIPPVSSSPSSTSSNFLEFSSGTLRRACSTGDLQGMNVSLPPPPAPLSGDNNCSQEAGEPFSQKVARYSAEERKEKIDKYRSKRLQRNFQKKITYACRKTLADSRPRVQGRFARNAETEAEAAAGEEMEMEAYGNSYEFQAYNDLTNSNCYGSQSQCRGTDSSSSSVTFDGSKWWCETGAANWQQQQQRALGFGIDDDEDELWASLAGMCSGT